MKFNIVVTGGIGCGKTLVCSLFEQYGISTIDADAISRNLTSVGQPGYKIITKEFGTSFLASNGSIDRRKLGKHIFKTNKDRKKLENILHPLIRDRIEKFLIRNSSNYKIVTIPLFLEGIQDIDYNRLLVVDSSPNLQIERVNYRSGLSQDEVIAIMQIQSSRTTRIAAADDLISNDGDINKLARQVSFLHSIYSALARDS